MLGTFANDMHGSAGSAPPTDSGGYPRENLKHGDKSPREVPWMVSGEEDLKVMVKMEYEGGTAVGLRETSIRCQRGEHLLVARSEHY